MKNNNNTSANQTYPRTYWKKWSDGTYTVNILFPDRRDVHVGTEKYLRKLLKEKYKIS